jgi:hypothetical protein
MTDHEQQIVKRALSYASQEVRAAQRCVEVLANLFEDMRHELYPHQASRIWYILNQIPNLERVPMIPLPDGEKAWPSSNQRYRWHFMTFPSNYEMRGLADQMDELSELLSGVKIEDVAQSKGYESYMQRFDPTAKIEFGFTGFKEMTPDQRDAYLNEMLSSKSPIMPIAKPREPFKNPAFEEMFKPKE